MKSDLKIFLVDDDPFSLYRNMKQLENSGYRNIYTLKNGEECILNLREKPQVIFLDYHMDQMNGLEVLQKIKRFCPDVYVVMLSGQQSLESVVNAMKSGAYDYIVKGEDDVKYMINILRQINLKKIEMIRSKTVFSPLRDLSPFIISVTFLFILQTSVVVYYYSSGIVSLFSFIILTVIAGIGFTYNQSVKKILAAL